MMVTLYNGVSGIKTNSYGLDVTASNIANINTVGYKGSLAEFKDVLYQSNIIGGFDPVYSQVGLGTSVATTALNLSNGNFQNTDNAFDFAIQGDGYFAVRAMGADATTYYTKAGEYLLDANRDLVNTSGLYLMGTMASFMPTNYSQAAIDSLVGENNANALTINTTQNLPFSDTQSKITLPLNLYLPPEPTSKVTFRGNLDGSQNFIYDEIGLNLNNAITSIDTDNKLNFSANIKDTAKFEQFLEEFDLSGEMVKITITYNGKSVQTTGKIDENGNFKLDDFDLNRLANIDEDKQYEKIDLNDLKISATATSPIKVEQATTAKFTSKLYTSSGYENILTINFTKQVPTTDSGINWDAVAIITDKDGKEVSRKQGILGFNETGALALNTLSTLDNSGTPLEINFGSIYNPDKANSGFDGVVVSNQKTTITHQEINGNQEGVVKDYAISSNGTILAIFSNGAQAAVARVPVFHFQNDQGLYSDGGVLFTQTANSGEPFMYVDKNGNKHNGVNIAGYMLENSNVSLANEFTMLVVQQRAYEASAKSITTADQMLQRVINMKND